MTHITTIRHESWTIARAFVGPDSEKEAIAFLHECTTTEREAWDGTGEAVEDGMTPDEAWTAVCLSESWLLDEAETDGDVHATLL